VGLSGQISTTYVERVPASGFALARLRTIASSRCRSSRDGCVPARFRDRSFGHHNQSALDGDVAAADRRHRQLDVAVIAPLREVKDPFRGRKPRPLQASSRWIRSCISGAARDAGMGGGGEGREDWRYNTR